MDAVTEVPETGEHAAEFEAARAEGGGERGREMLAHVANGAELDHDEENDALEWLLGAPKATVHDVPVDYEGPDGTKSKLTFVVRRTDLKLIDRIEQRNIDGSGRLDRIKADTEIVAECCEALVSATGREVKLDGDEFLTVRRRGSRGELEPFKHASPAIALEERFADQLGLMSTVAMEIRRLAGVDGTRVGVVKRRLVQSSLG